MHKHADIYVKNRKNRCSRKTNDNNHIQNEGHLKSSWTGGNAPLLHRERQWLMPSCSGGGNVVVAWSSSL